MDRRRAQQHKRVSSSRLAMSGLVFSVLYGSEHQRTQLLLRIVNKALFIAVALICIISYVAGWSSAMQVTACDVFLYSILFFAIRAGYVRTGGLLIIISLWFSVSYALYMGDGINDVGIVVYPIVLTIGAILLNRLYYSFLVVFCLAALAWIGYAELHGVVHVDFAPFVQAEDVYTVIILVLLSGVIIRLMTEFTAVTLRRANDRERQYSQILNTLHDAVFIHDIETLKILDVNDTMLEMYGYRRSEIATLSVEQLSDPADLGLQEQIKAHCSEARTTGTTNFLWRGMRRDGNLFWSHVVITPMYVDGVQRLVAIVRDVDAQLKLEEQLKQAEKLTAIGQLAGGIAHDFNNMLAGIMGAAEVMAMKERGADDQRMLDLITKSSQRAADLTGKLLTFSKKRALHMQALDLHSVIEEACDLLERSIDKRISLGLDLAAEQVFVMGDRAQLLNVFLNLGINASDAMSDAGMSSEAAIRFSTQNCALDASYCAASVFDLKPGDYVKLCVHDNGGGIPDTIKNRIFEPFFSTKESSKNNGLGLAAAYGVIKDHGGEIEVDSEPGDTTFTLYMQICAAPDVEDVSAQELHKGSACILLVDDEPTMRLSVQSMLEHLGYQVICVENGKRALAVFEQKRAEIDLVLLDMIMPEMNGRDCFYALRALEPQLKVILSSGYSDDISIDKLLHDGACGFLRKPYRMHELAQELKKHTA